MRYNVEKIKEIVRKNPNTEIIYFWGHTPNHKKMTKSCLVSGMMFTLKWMESNITRLNNT